MYKSKIKKYPKIFLCGLILYYVCLLITMCLSMEYADVVWEIYQLTAYLFVLAVNCMTLLRQDKYIAQKHRNIYNKYKCSWRRPQAISLCLLLKGKNAAEIEDILKESKYLIKFDFFMITFLLANIFLMDFIIK